MPEMENKQSGKKVDSKAKKLITIIVTTLILLIPVGFMAMLINGRADYRDEAVKNVSASWANIQNIDVPQMYFNVVNSKKEMETKYLNLNNYKADVKITTEIRKKGIFKVPVYTAEISQKGDFINDYGNLKDKNITIKIDVSDPKGFVAEPVFKINNEAPVSKQNTIYTKVIKSAYKTIPFEINYKIKGLNSIAVSVYGENNQITMEGNWKDPSFQGDFLPSEREVTNQGFKAMWSVPKIAIKDYEVIKPKAEVSLLVPADNYSMTQKSLKYCFLFLSLVFLSYFIFEVTAKENMRIHPIQYCLLGGAMLIFYLLLVSVSEILSFNLAYLISALMITGLVFMYTYFVISKRKSLGFSLTITVLMGILYAFFYILLLLQDIALLAGSIGLFIIIALIMYLTRNVNWYNE